MFVQDKKLVKLELKWTRFCGSAGTHTWMNGRERKCSFASVCSVARLGSLDRSEFRSNGNVREMV